MKNLTIYCTTIKYYKVLDNLPDYIKPLGLGENIYPDYWFDEKEHKVYFFEFLPYNLIVPDIENHGYIEFHFKFSVFDIKNNLIETLIKPKKIT